MEWQTIENAPFEISILIYDGGSRFPGIYTAHKWSIGDSVYWSGDGVGGPECENEFDDPTHWMPLPAPPVKQDM